MKFKVVRLCQPDTMSIVPLKPAKYDLDRVANVLQENGYKIENPGVMVVAVKEGRDITVYKSGRLLIHPVKSKADAERIAESFYDFLESALAS